MSVTKNQVFAVLAAVTLVATYFLFSIVLPPKLEFRDRNFPRGFRDLALDSASSQFDPLFGFQQAPLVDAASKQDQQEVCDALFRDPESPAVGNRDSEVQIVAFLDYRCPYCKKLTYIMSKMQADNVRIVYKEWPILGDSSLLAARAGLSGRQTGKISRIPHAIDEQQAHSNRFVYRADCCRTRIEPIATTYGYEFGQYHACNPAHIRAGIGPEFTWDTGACRRTHDCSGRNHAKST
jgi:hypothetical protein